MEWVVGAIERVCKLCQRVGVERAQARRERIEQLRGTLASAEQLLQNSPSDQFFISAKNTAEQELTKKEIKRAEWEAIRSSARWHQIDIRMNKNLFLGVQQAKNNPPIQQLIDEHGTEYSTNEEMAQHATSYYQSLFMTQGESEECLQARDVVWRTIPKKSQEP